MAPRVLLLYVFSEFMFPPSNLKALKQLEDAQSLTIFQDSLSHTSTQDLY